MFEDNNKTAHWFDHSKLKPLDTESFSKEKYIDDIQAKSQILMQM